MKSIGLSMLALFIAMPLYGQGLTITMKETGPIGETAPAIQTDRTHARLDAPSLATQVLYDSSTKTLRLIVPLLRSYREYTPATIASAPPIGGRGQPVPAPTPITYKRTGSSKVKDWTCTTYEGSRGSEKVVEVCAAEGASIGLTPPELIERIPTYGSVASQGFAGFPVRRVSFRNGQPEFTTELVEVRRGAVPAENFAVPAGFTKAP
jgi:hypothetical protein